MSALPRALETPDDAIDEIILRAQEEIRTKGRSKEEQEADLKPRASLPPGASRLAAALRYQERNLAEGKCSVCPKPLARNSVRFCEEHLAKQRGKDQQKRACLCQGAANISTLAK